MRGYGLFALQWYECLLVDLPWESLHVCTACIRRCNAQGCVDAFMGHIYKLTVQKESTAVIISSQGSEKASVLVLTPGVSLHSSKFD